jgi:hypothetical protein
MSNEFLKHAADLMEAEYAADALRSLEGSEEDNYGRPVYEAADALAKALDLLKADPDYAEVLGISRRGMDFINGAEATLRAASIDL